MKQLGVVVPIVTPCTPAGKIDVGGLQAVCDDQMNAGCHGMFVNGTTGRGPWFSRKDRMTICRTIAGRIKKGTPLMAGCMAVGLDEMLGNAKAMADCGAHMAVATAPMYFPYSGKELESIFLKFADASPIPIIIYDIPDLTGTGLKPELLVKLAKHQNVAGFKDSSANYDNFKQLLDTLGASVPDFLLMQGKEHLLKDSLVAGASGFVVSLLHVNPRPFVALYNAVQKGDEQTAQRMQEVIKEIMECCKVCFAKAGNFSTLSHFLNTALKMRGINVNICLEHEGECPDWLAEKARQAVELSMES